jgi:hypothetical protein
LTLALSIGLFLCGLIADGINTNHRLLEEVLFHLRRVEYEPSQTHRGSQLYDAWASSEGRDGPRSR